MKRPKLKEHAKEILKIEDKEPEWEKMILCGLATTLPLLIGMVRGELAVSLFGALTGFMLTLNDHWGSLGHRIWNLTLTILILQLGFFLGVLVEGHYFLTVLGLWCLTYWTGLMGGKGAEFERAILFSVFQFLAGSMMKFPSEMVPAVIFYGCIGYVVTIALMTFLHFLRRKAPAAFARTRASMKSSVTFDFQRHFFATFYATAILMTFLLVESIHLDRGYWAVGTALLIMKPDPKLTVYRGLQRILGTVLGVLIVEALIYSLHDPKPIVALVLLTSFITPWFLTRSYWVVSGLTTIMVLLLLDLPHISLGDLMTPILRLEATAIGSGMAIAGVIVINMISLSIKKRPSQKV